MFRITYGYYRIDENFEPIGDAIVKYVDGETVKQVNDAFHFIGYNHDLSKYLSFVNPFYQNNFVLIFVHYTAYCIHT